MLSFRLLFSFVVRFGHGLAQRRNLFEQLLEFDAGETFNHGRELGDDLSYIAGQFARAATDTVSGIDDDHLLRF